MERRQGKQYIIYKWSHAENSKAKRLIRVKTPKIRSIYQSKVPNHISTKFVESSSSFVSWKLNTSLTQKDTMDRRAWIKKFRKKGMQEDSKERTKVQKHKKVQNVMGMRNKWIFMFTICYNRVVSKLEATRRKR